MESAIRIPLLLRRAVSTGMAAGLASTLVLLWRGRKELDSPAAPVNAPAHWIAVVAPNLGTFYRAPKPGAPPFVNVGQTVTPETEMCLLEVMKLFTTVTAGAGGVVRRICVQDAEMVEFGETLFYIEPA